MCVDVCVYACIGVCVCMRVYIYLYMYCTFHYICVHIRAHEKDTTKEAFHVYKMHRYSNIKRMQQRQIWQQYRCNVNAAPAIMYTHSLYTMTAGTYAALIDAANARYSNITRLCHHPMTRNLSSQQQRRGNIVKHQQMSNTPRRE